VCAVQATPNAECATLVHGDYKAMNVFLPPEQPTNNTTPSTELNEPLEGGLLIDFASTGVGFGMTDVAMLLSHSVAPSLLEEGGEERLVDVYLRALARARQANKQHRADTNGSPEYSRALALRHYRLGVVDYGRFVVARFWGGASAEAFSKRASSPNTTLVNRNVEAALAFVARVDACLRHFEVVEGACPDGKPDVPVKQASL
jgi:hypothetical protein